MPETDGLESFNGFCTIVGDLQRNKFVDIDSENRPTLNLTPCHEVIIEELHKRDISKDDWSKYLIIIANPESEVQELHKAKKNYDFIDLQVRPLPQKELYTYLHASDVLLIHRESSTKYHAVVSSSVCQVLGSGCPILFHESNYVENHGDEIWKYQDFNDLKDKLIDVFNNKFNLGKVKSYLEQHSAEQIANRYLELFEDLMKAREKK